jgi:heat shock protein HslJ
MKQIGFSSLRRKQLQLLRWPLLAVALFTASCSSTHKSVANSPGLASSQLSLLGTEWALADLNSIPPLANVQATLSFSEEGRITGNGSCNRFTGSVTISRDTLKIGPLASTRITCLNGNVGAQKDKYLRALGAANRYAWQDPYLVIYCDGCDQPLRFTLVPASSS